MFCTSIFNIPNKNLPGTQAIKPSSGEVYFIRMIFHAMPLYINQDREKLTDTRNILLFPVIKLLSPFPMAFSVDFLTFHSFSPPENT